MMMSDLPAMLPASAEPAIRMDYDQIEQRLVIAEQHATDGARHIEQQKRLIDELQRGGHDATQAR
jgi:hypothetical protein